MSSEWPLVRLGDLVTLKGGFAYKGEHLGSGEVKLLGMGVVSHSERFLKNGMRSYGGEFSESFRANSGDIVIATRQQSDNLPILGCPALVPSDLTNTDIVVGTNLYKVTNQSDVDNKFLYWLLRGNEYRNRILECSKGTTVRMITKDAVENFTFPCPPLPVRREISHFLDALDDRITLLRETNATLEAIARALFKSWFVDFDPVRAKMEGRTPEGMDEATAALFPDGVETSELGEVPKGWSVTPFSTIVSVSSGKRPECRADSPSSAIAVPLYGGAGVMGYTSSSLFDVPKILTGRVGTLGKVHIAYPPFWASDNVLVVTPKNPLFFSFAHHWLLLIDVTALNRGSTQPLLTQRDLGAQIGVVPSSQVLEAFEGVAASLTTRILANAKQADTLSILRDTLLPRLISGQLRLPNAEMEATTA